MKEKFTSTKIIDLGSCAFRQWRASSDRPNAGTNSSRCSFVHGYRLMAKFWFVCTSLDSKNWCVDFGGLKPLKDVLNTQFDHTLCVASDDPNLQLFEGLHKAGACDLRVMPDGVGIERVAQWCFNAANKFVLEMTNNRCWVEKVEVWEHDQNSAIYEPHDTTLSSGEVTDGPGVPEIELKAAPEIKVEQSQPSQPVSTHQPGLSPARVGNQVTTGWGDPFKGTSWGANK